MDNLEITGSLYDSLQILEHPGQEMGNLERLRAMNRPLLAWYETHARVLPWREDPTPYRVWISEIMLQQTRVEAVRPYFERFLKELPDVAALANVEDDQLMKLWQGLGYYNRARNLKKAACMILEQYEGNMPEDAQELLKLPGIGSYTAGAVSSIAFGKAVPAVDGNVLRVLSRVLASYEDILKQSTKSWMEKMLSETMPEKKTSEFTQGLIEIGAIICVPNGAPHCEECPLNSICLGRKKKLLKELPIKTPPQKRKKENRTVCILQNDEGIALHKRPEEGLLAGLYELPNVLGNLQPEELPEAFYLDKSTVLEILKLPDAKHIFSHIEWHMTGYKIIIRGDLPDEWITASREEIKQIYALPNAFGKFIKHIDEA